MADYNGGLQVLAHNATIQLEVAVEDIHHFRPRRGEKGRESAVITLKPVYASPHFAKILDQREDSILISRGLANIRVAEKRVKSLLDQKKVEQAKTEARENWPEFLKLNASVLLDFEEAASRRRYPVLILRDPDQDAEGKDVDVDGLLTTIGFETGPDSSFSIRESRGSWYRMVRSQDENGINHFLVLTVTGKKSLLGIYHRVSENKSMTATDYLLADSRAIVRREARIIREEWLEGEPIPEAAASFEERAQPDEDNPRDHPLQNIGGLQLGINGAVDSYLSVGIDTVGKLIDADPATVKAATGIKVGTIRIHKKEAEQYVKDNQPGE